MPEEHDFLGDYACPLTSKNRIPGSATMDAFITDTCIFRYESVKGIFASMLDLSGATSSAPLPPSLPGGRRRRYLSKAQDR